MAGYRWTGAAVANNTAVNASNINLTGNGDPVTYATSGGGTYQTAQFTSDIRGKFGIYYTGASGQVPRLDALFSASAGIALKFKYTSPTAPTTSDLALAIPRNNNAGTTDFGGYIQHQVATSPAQGLAFRTAGNTNTTSTLTAYSASSSVAPAMTAGHTYEIEAAYIHSASATTTNGRIIGWVKSLTAPGTYNGGTSWFFDSGYNTNVGLYDFDRFRFGKLTSAAVQSDGYLMDLEWRNLVTPDSTLTLAGAKNNLVQASGPTVTKVNTGTHYLISHVATAVVGGAITYGISYVSGPTTNTPTQIGPGLWIIDRDTAGDMTYTTTATEAGGGVTTNTEIVPAQVAAISGQFRRRRLVSGVLT